MARQRDIPAAVAEAAIVLIALFLAFVAGAAGWAVGHSTRHTRTVTVAASGVTSASATPVDPHVAAGAHDFTVFACAQCHGDRGRGGVSADVPALTQVGKQLTVAQLKQIIDHGLGESANPKKPYMPVWGQVVSAHQVADLVAYIH